MSTILPHIMRIQNACLKCAARGSPKIQDTKSSFWHYRTTLSGCTFVAMVCIGNRIKLLNADTSSTCPHNMVNFGLLTAEFCWRVLGTPANFNGFASWQRYCTALQQWASAKLCGIEQRAPPIFGRAAITLKLIRGFGFGGFVKSRLK